MTDAPTLEGIMRGDATLPPKLARAAAAITDSPARIEATQQALADALRRKPEPIEPQSENTP
jgi:hypothetical protein